MFLRSIELRHVRSIERLRLSFLTEDGLPRPWTLILGDNGAGKSTILRILSGELDADEGEATIGGSFIAMTQDVGMSQPNDTLREMLIEVAPRQLRDAGRRLVAAEKALTVFLSM